MKTWSLGYESAHVLQASDGGDRPVVRGGAAGSSALRGTGPQPSQHKRRLTSTATGNDF